MAAERRFHCTACGKCCQGRLPLTLDDAIANAGLFPLAMLWTTLRKGAKAFDITERLGTSVKLGNRKHVAVQITPISYIPPSHPCPALTPDDLCAIQEAKPLRCRAMPFYAYRDEEDQTDLLIPRPGWECDISSAAPIVYRDKKVIQRKDFNAERQKLLEQAPTLRSYADRLLTTAPNVAAGVEKAAKKSRGGYVVLNFTAILSRLPKVDVTDFCKKQLPVLKAFAKKTKGKSDQADFHRNYTECATGMERLLARR